MHEYEDIPAVLATLAARRSAAQGDAVAATDVDAGGRETPRSWQSLGEAARRVGRALVALGMAKGDRLCVMSPNTVRVLATDLGAYAAGCVPVGVYVTASPKQTEYVLNDTGSTLFLAGDARALDVALSIRSDVPLLKHIVVMDGNIYPGIDGVLSWDAFLALGDATDPREVQERSATVTPGDVATVIYTSGSTGEPKGAVLTHGNFDAAMAMHARRLPALGPGDVSLCFLPLSHIFEKAWTYFCLIRGIRVVVNADPGRIAAQVQATRPTCMCSVPRFWEKAYTAVKQGMDRLPWPQRLMARRAVAVGRRRNLHYVRRGLDVPRWLQTRYRFYDRRVLEPLRRRLGVDRGVLFPTAGAPLSTHITEFLLSCGIPVLIGYGLSETTATVTCYPRVDYRPGTVGVPLDGVQVRISDNGEVLVKGPTVMKGYLNKPLETAAAFTAGGWLRTGDAGYLDDRGNLTLTERIKDLIKTSNGKYIAPQVLETRLGEDPYIDRVAVIGESRRYVTALVVPAIAALKRYAARHGITADSIEALLKNSRIHAFLQRRIERLQAGLPAFERIKKFELLPQGFSIDNGELTNTLKLRRAVINDHYRPLIDAMYE